MPFPKRRRQTGNYDHGELIHRAQFGFVAAAIAVILASMALSFSRGPTHALLIDLPGEGEIQEPAAEWPQDLPRHRITVTNGGAIEWDGHRVDPIEVGGLLKAAANDEARPGIELEAQPLASYDVTLRILSAIERSGIMEDRFRFVGLESHAEFGKD